MKFQHWLVLCIVAMLALMAYIDKDSTAQCEKRMSREVCLHTLYP